MLSRRTKITLYKVLVTLVALDTCCTWATIKTDENRLATFNERSSEEYLGQKKQSRSS